jgi:hypothetical protein
MFHTVTKQYRNYHNRRGVLPRAGLAIWLAGGPRAARACEFSISPVGD